MFNIGDLVTRKSHNNDIVFEIINIEEDVYYLKGVSVRLYVDSYKDDLVEVEIDDDSKDEKELLSRVKNHFKLDRSDYFYLPGKILHIDGDHDYLNKCLEYYKKIGVFAVGKEIKEELISENILDLIKIYTPSIIVITGHDAYYKDRGKINDMSAYKNSQNFVNAIKAAREYEISHDKLIIIAGACQSNYEELIKAGANFASSPKRTNIHALDPAVIASYMALYDSGKYIDIKKVLDSTKYGSDGIGGIITKGTMYIGYPR